MRGEDIYDVVLDLRPRGGGRWIEHALLSTTGKTLNDAADEIERLRAACCALARGGSAVSP